MPLTHLLDLKGLQITANGTLAAFSNARDETSALLNTYVVYQAEDGKIRYGVDTNSLGCQGPKVDAVFVGGISQRISLV